jgi:hypothetical protein
MSEKVQISPENFWRDVWHTNCVGRFSSPMKHLRQTITIEDGSVLHLYECTDQACGARVFGGLDAKRIIVTRPFDELENELEQEPTPPVSPVVVGTVVINARPYRLACREFTFEELVAVTHATERRAPFDAYAVKYRSDTSDSRQELRRGETLEIQSGMILDVYLPPVPSASRAEQRKPDAGTKSKCKSCGFQIEFDGLCWRHITGILRPRHIAQPCESNEAS